jgi:hypothetical protein
MFARPSTPGDVHPPALRALAVLADRIDRLEAAAEALAGPDRLGEGLDDLCALVLMRLEDEDAILAVALAEWLAADPEHAPILRLEAFLPWRAPGGGWDLQAPRWARVLATHAELARPGLAEPAPAWPG